MARMIGSRKGMKTKVNGCRKRIFRFLRTNVLVCRMKLIVAVGDIANLFRLRIRIGFPSWGVDKHAGIQQSSSTVLRTESDLGSVLVLGWGDGCWV